jgi:hypothetical protein
MSADVPAAIDAAWRGDFGPSRELARARPSSAWSIALEAHRALGESLAMPAIDPIDDPAALAHAAIAVLRDRLLACDTSGLERIARVLEQGDAEPLWAIAARGWAKIAKGDLGGVDDGAEKALREATRERNAPLVIELETLRAMTAIEERRLEQATQLARRASRMARTEALPQQEYLAHLVLARVRRQNGHAHLATRIGRALARFAPPRYHRAIEWELRMAGARFADDDPYAVLGDRGLAAWELARAAARGDRAGYETARRELADAAGSFAPYMREARALDLCLDPLTSPARDDEVRAWAAGELSRIPFGLGGVALAIDDPSGELSWVVRGERGVRRILAPGLGLADHAHRVEPGKRRQGRLETALAMLVLADREGLEERAFFRELYGFDYEASVHEGVYRVLVHRLRAELPPRAELLRDAGRIALVLDEPIAVPDPRTAPPIGERALRVIAAHPGATAKDLAELAAIPLRTLQSELQHLVNEGACNAERSGRQISYFVEDTTFSEPTQHGLRGDASS